MSTKRCEGKVTDLSHNTNMENPNFDVEGGHSYVVDGIRNTTSLAGHDFEVRGSAQRERALMVSLTLVSTS